MGMKEFLMRVPALRGASPEAFGQLLNVAATRTLERGNHLWRAGDAPLALTAIRSGLVKIVKSNINGKQTICGLFGPPETLADAPVLRGTPFPADAVVATTKVELVEIPREALLTAASSEPQLGLSLAGSIQQKLNTLMAKIDVLSAGSVEARLATLLTQLQQQYGDDFDDGSSTVMVALSRRELADLVSTSFETAIRAMTKWEREGIVETLPNGFRITDHARLRVIAGEVT